MITTEMWKKIELGQFDRPSNQQRGRLKPSDGGAARKLDWDKVRRIRSLRDAHTNQQLAEMFGIGTNAVSNIMRGASWKE